MSEHNESVRKEVLFQHYALKGIPISSAQIERECRKQRTDYTRTEIGEAQQFLADDGLLVLVPMPGTTAKLYRINSEGVRHYEQNYAS